jgi:hypothetical protein
MRSLLFICSFFAGLNTFSQDTLATVLNHDWAAGQCCSSGTDITFTLSDKLTPSDFDSLVYISSGSSSVVLYPDDFHSQILGQKNRCIVSYGWNNNSPGDYSTSGLTRCYGLPENRFTTVNNQKAQLLVYLKNGKMKQAAVKEQFTITAFP